MRPTTRRSRWIPAVIVLALLLQACGGDGVAPDGGTTATPGTTAVSTPGSERPEDGDTGDGEPDDGDAPRRTIIAWILDLAPSAPEGPTGFEVYERLRRRDCDGVLDAASGLDDGTEEGRRARTLYEGAASACLAAFEGRTGRWGAAERALAGVRDDTGDLSCLDVVVLRVLEQLVAAHRDNPDGRLVPATGRGDAHAPPCPELTGLTPAHGPAGTTLTLTGRNLDRVDRVGLHDGDVFVRFLSPPLPGTDRRLTLEMPADLDRTGTLCVTLIVDEPSEWYVAGAPFRLEAEAGSGETEAGSGAAVATPATEPSTPDAASCPPPSPE